MALTQVSRGLLSTSIDDNGNATAITIDSSENVLVGTTDSAPGVGNTNTGGAFGSNGYGVFSRTGTAGQATAYFNKNTNDGEIIKFNKDGSTVGSIGTSGSQIYIGTGASGLFFNSSTNQIYPLNTATQANEDGTQDLGRTTARFKDIYLSGRSRIDNNTNISMSGTGDGQLMISGNGYDGAIALDATGMNIYHNSSGRAIIFGTNETERARIDSSGHLNVGFSSFSSMGSTNTGGRLSADGTTNALARGSNGVVLYLYSGSGGAGNITVTGNTASYNETSDQRLKENIVEAPSSSDDIDAIQVRSFDWKADGRHQKYGMIAQELNTVAPDAVTIPEDPDEMAGVDYSKLVPMLVKEIQSLRARVAQLENN